MNTIELNISPNAVDDKLALRANIGIVFFFFTFLKANFFQFINFCCLGPEKISYIDFVKEGWRRWNKDSIGSDQTVKIINAQTIFLDPDVGSNKVKLSFAKKVFKN